MFLLTCTITTRACSIFQFSTRAAVKASNALSWNYGNFIQTVINFFIISACVFVIVKRKVSLLTVCFSLFLELVTTLSLPHVSQTFSQLSLLLTALLFAPLPYIPFNSVPDGQKHKDGGHRKEMPFLLRIYRTHGCQVFEMHQLVGPGRIRTLRREPCQET